MIDMELIEKLNGFNHIKFNEDDHTYMVGDIILTSTTTFLKKFEPEKDWDGIAYKYSLKNGETPSYWKLKWQQEGIIGSEKGSMFHLYAENSIANKVYIPPFKRLLETQEKCSLVDVNLERALKRIMLMWDVFWLQAKGNLIPIRSEFIVGDLDHEIGGMIDQLFWNVKMKEIQIWDWKTNKKIAKANKYQSFLHPISHLDECEFNKYSLQLAIYKYILEKNLGIKIGNCYIGYFYEGNMEYKVLKTREMKQEVEQILNAA